MYSLPQKTKWQQRAISRELCVDRATVKFYAEQICIYIPDYLKECPRNPDGSVQSGFALSQYQFWVLYRVLIVAREIRESLNGRTFRPVVKATVIKLAQTLSEESFNRQSEANVA